MTTNLHLEALRHIIDTFDASIVAEKAKHQADGRCSDPDHPSWPDDLIEWTIKQWTVNLKQGQFRSILSEFKEKMEEKDQVNRDSGTGKPTCQLTDSECSSIRSVVTLVETEISILLQCPYCVLNYYDGDGKFSTLCPQPHVAVWAKLGQYPYWPAKLLSLIPAATSSGTQPVNNRASVWFFGPEHQTATVPLDRIVFVSDPKVNPDKGWKVTKLKVSDQRKSYKKAIKSLGEYIQKLEEAHPHTRFRWPKGQTKYDGHTITYSIPSTDHQPVHEMETNSPNVSMDEDYDTFSSELFSSTEMIAVPNQFLDQLLLDERWIRTVPIESADLPDDLVSEFVNKMQIPANNASCDDDDDLTDIESRTSTCNDYDGDTEIEDIEVGDDVSPQSEQPVLSWFELRKQQIREKSEADKQRQREKYEKMMEDLRKQNQIEINELQKQLDELNRPLLIAAGRITM